MPARKVHYTYVDPSLTIPVCFDSFYCSNSLNFKVLVKPCISMSCI